MSFWNEKEAKKIMQKLPFYNVLIEKPKIKDLSNIDLLYEIPFYDELSVVPAGKYWSLGRPEDVPLQRRPDVPERSYLTIPGTFRSDVPETSRSDDLGTS